MDASQVVVVVWGGGVNKIKINGATMENGQRRRGSDIREISVSSNMLNSLK